MLIGFCMGDFEGKRSLEDEIGGSCRMCGG
jgi:hypothetical protein